MSKQPQDVVITGIGAVTAAGIGMDAQWQHVESGAQRSNQEEYALKTFKPAPHLSDRRMLKAVSSTDAIGLAAVEGLKKTLKFEPRPYTPERTGLYVGAPPASAFDNAFYVDAMEASRDANGKCQPSEFGRTAMGAMPMTLLVGLPNNVLCYGAMIFDAKGPNSNYTSVMIGGHMAVMNGARRVRRGQLDLAIAGAFSAHSDAVNGRMLMDLGVASRDAAKAEPFVDADVATGAVLADGAAFVALERRAAAEARGADIIGTYLGGAMTSDGLGPLEMDKQGEALESAIRRALTEAGLTPSDIGLTLAGASGFAPADLCEFSVLSRVFANERDFPALGSSCRSLGCLAEAGGLVEIGMAARIHRAGELPAALRPGGYAADSRFGSKVPASKPNSLILRVSPWGEYSAIVIGH